MAQTWGLAPIWVWLKHEPKMEPWYMHIALKFGAFRELVQVPGHFDVAKIMATRPIVVTTVHSGSEISVAVSILNKMELQDILAFGGCSKFLQPFLGSIGY